jgi:hypothetical protein
VKRHPYRDRVLIERAGAIPSPAPVKEARSGSEKKFISEKMPFMRRRIIKPEEEAN